MDYEQATKDLRRSLALICEIERRQPLLRRGLVPLTEEQADAQQRIEQNLAEIAVKLNRLLGRGKPNLLD